MSDIFISYAREDRPRAEAVAKALQDRGWSVWWDRDLLAGDTIRRVIREQIDKAGSVVVLWSNHSVDSDWVNDEASRGRRRKVLVPARIDDADIPLGFGPIHAADLTGWMGDATAPAFRMLCASIAALTGPRAQTQTMGDGLSYVWIPPGEFQMGATDGDTEAYRRENPRHPVRITSGFWLSDTTVTVAAYKRFVSERPDFKMPPPPDFNPDWSKAGHPIVRVTFDEAQAYCEWAGGQLPAEAQWEYAARGGKDGMKYAWGNDLTPKNANYAGSKWGGTSPVRSYPASAWGLYDMVGNVWEWVADWYDAKYYTTLPLNEPTEDPPGPQSGKLRVLRGGSFLSDSRGLRAASRHFFAPGAEYKGLGFRCLREKHAERALAATRPKPWL
jgi:formylglycine-generating enzyme required for sulfatase activity